MRNQVTLWGPDGQIHDYARKEWGGLMAEFYAPRWEMFFKELIKYKEHYNHKNFLSDLMKHVERPFSYSKKSMPSTSQGSLIDIAKKIFHKYYLFVRALRIKC